MWKCDVQRAKVKVPEVGAMMTVCARLNISVRQKWKSYEEDAMGKAATLTTMHIPS